MFLKNVDIDLSDFNADGTMLLTLDAWPLVIIDMAEWIKKTQGVN